MRCSAIWTRKGLYPIKSYPQVLGMEASGTIVALPTDESVLSNEEYKKRSLQIGSKVAVVRRLPYAQPSYSRNIYNLAHLTSHKRRRRTSLASTLISPPFHGARCSLFHPTFPCAPPPPQICKASPRCPSSRKPIVSRQATSSSSTPSPAGLACSPRSSRNALGQR